ncbi:MAG TPA: DUF488 domain-containing protein [Burkholderiales bacterium]|nr:DUF488 domain-containing protein [Burkholderiales bacterium]
MPLKLKRAYDAPEPDDGLRVLVDRLWPRGVSKDSAHVDLWLKELAPSAALRKWFGHDPAKWDEFRARYRRELASQAEAVARLVELARKGPVTLVYGAADRDHNNAVALREVLESRRR